MLALAARAARGSRATVAISRAASVHTSRKLSAYSWEPSSTESLQHITKQALVHELTQQQVVSAGKLVPWFLGNMPEAYFRQVSEETRVEHLKAMSALYGSISDMSLTLKSITQSGDTEVTFIRPSNRIGLLRELVEDLPSNVGDLRRMMVYTALDSSLVLNIFTFSKETKPACTPQSEFSHVLEYAAKVQNGEFAGDATHVEAAPYLEKEPLTNFLSALDSKHLSSTDARRLLKHVRAFQTVSGTENVDVDLEVTPADSDVVRERYNTQWLTVAFGNVFPKQALVGVTQILEANKLDVIRSHLNLIPDGENRSVTLLRVLVGSIDQANSPSQDLWNRITHCIKRMKWVDEDVLHLGVVQHPTLGLARAEVITGLCALVHGVLCRESSWAFSQTNMMNMVSHNRCVKHVAAIADLFINRFNPQQPLSTTDFQRAKEDLVNAITSEVEDAHANKLLLCMVEAVGNIFRTNFFVENRYALGMRLNPKFLMPPNEKREMPYGVFFVHGERFNGFHVRFRDIARGGVRLVTPGSKEQLALERARHYNEVFNLANAQQLKNKDIPEGGSKAVLLLDCVGQTKLSKERTMRKSMKAFTDSLLDMIVETPERSRVMLDLWGKPEHLYLGPDEQVIPDDISWVVNRAAVRGLPAPSTFMSSKADEGINHKEFGVTSEGVVVFLDVALRYAGINPSKDKFTVKITGGPNGDVAGNCMNILFRDYGDRVRIVGVCDHSGTAEDPNGLDRDELLRLFREERAINEFNPAKLGARGSVSNVDTDEGIKLRNTMHNRVVADAFIPAGGRPDTISAANWRQYLRQDGTPSSRVIVEGANLFITPEARLELCKHSDVIIVKDSSANKCGVICSSYEIISSMLMSGEEFASVKKELVAEVLQRLRHFARLEAELLFNEFHNFPGALPFFSERISRSINRLKDSIREALSEHKTVEDLAHLLPIFYDHLPKTMLDIGKDRIPQRVPLQYIRNAIASTLASRIVYKEGTMYTDTLPEDRIAEIAVKYYEAEKEVDKLVHAIASNQLDDKAKEQVVQLVKTGAVRTLLSDSMRNQ